MSTPTMTMRLVGRSMRSHAVSTPDMRSLRTTGIGGFLLSCRPATASLRRAGGFG